MKTSIKVAFILLGIGFCLIFFGILSGAQTSFQMPHRIGFLRNLYEKQWIFRDRCWKDRDWDWDEENSEEVSKGKFQSKGQMELSGTEEKLLIDVNDYRLKLIPSKNQNLNLRWEEDGKSTGEAFVKNNAFCVRLDSGRRNKFKDWNFSEPQGEIEVPPCVKKVEIRGIGGQLISKIDMDELKVETEFLRLQLDKTNLSALDLQIDAGQIVLNEVSSKVANIQVDAGDIRLNQTKIKNGRIEIDAGQFVLKGGGMEDSSIEVDAGNVEIYGEITGRLTAHVDLGNIIVQPAQDVDVKVEAELGRISYRGKVETNPFQLKKGQKGEVILTVEAGNIEIR